MEQEKVKELNEIKEKLGIPSLLLRVIVAYSIVYTKKYDRFTPSEMIYQVAKESLNKIDIKYVNSIAKNDFSIKVYGKSLVHEVVQELRITDTKKNNM